jgi:beta-glucosidase
MSFKSNNMTLIIKHSRSRLFNRHDTYPQNRIAAWRAFSIGDIFKMASLALALGIASILVGRAHAACPCEGQTEPDYLLAYNEQHANPAAAAPASSEASVPRYLDPRFPIEERVDDLMPRLTLDEKISQLIDSWGSPGIARLNVPAMFKTEGLHSQSYSTGATLLPMPIEMAGTFDPALINEVGQATAVEAKAANIRVTWSPVLDVARDARWGRVEETYGEDPYLVSRMGVAWINGFQSEGMIAIPKHFAGHGGPLGGRDSNDVGLSDRTMREIFLPPFRAAVEEARAGGVMAAYSTWDGTPDNASMELLQNILRQEWGFNGVVVSDCGGPEHFLTKQSVVSNLEESCQLAIRAGVDIECGDVFKKALASAVHDGLLSESDLDVNVRDVLRTKLKLGLFENPGPQKMIWDKLPEYDTPEHRALARQVATEGIVLLKNSDHLLPLSKTLGTIAVIGPDADEAQTGDYSPKLAAGQMVTVLQGVESCVGPGTKVLYARGCDATSDDTSGIAAAVDIARQADAVVLVVGDHSHDGGKSTTGENNDGATLEIPGRQRELIKAVQATGKPVVLVLVNGKPFTLGWESKNIPAILETWYPGEEGGNATADIIFGDQNPSGRLPITLPRNVGQLPLNYDYLPSGRNYDYFDMPFTPLYRFGFGLSYTTFKYSNLTITPREDDPGFVTVSVDIENTGDRDGDEVAQLYITDTLTSVITPVIQLKGVKRVSLKKGEKKTVTFELTPYELSFLNADMERVIEPAKFRIHVGGVSPEPPAGSEQHKQKIGFKKPTEGVTGEFEMPKMYHADFKYDVEAPARVHGGESFPVTVTVTNNGNLLDLAKIDLYGDNLLGSHRFEIAPGEMRTYTFNVELYKNGALNLTAIVGRQAVTRTVEFSRSPANLVLRDVKTGIGDDGVLHYQAEASNTGGEAYKGQFVIRMDGAIAAGKKLELSPGAHQTLQLSCVFPHSGEFHVKLGDAAEQQMVVPGGIGLALSDPLVYLNFDSASVSGVKNEINGTMLTVEGTPQFVAGKEGQAFETRSGDTYVKAGKVDLYRKPFTLAAWVNVEELGDRQAMFFGGQAPMGASVDTSGTGLAAGVFEGTPFLSFWSDKDVHGETGMATGKWVHVAYTYNPDAEEGSIYIDGKLDKSSSQQPYTGPLDTIGGAFRFNHGKYAIDDVLVTHDCLDAKAVGVLANDGVQALQKGEMLTDWRSVSSALSQLETWSDIPAGATIKVTVETGDGQNNVVDSKTVDLKSGCRTISLEGLKVGARARLHVRLTATKWGSVPTLQSVSLLGISEPIRWATVAEWQKGSPAGGLKIQM